MTRGLALACVLVVAAQARAGVLVARTKGPQIDEAVAALKAGLAGDDVSEMNVDEATSVDALSQQASAHGVKLVVAVGARAAQLAVKQPLPVVHCMVVQDAASLDGPKSAGVALSLPAKAQLSALLSVTHGAKKVGLLYDPRLNARFLADANEAARGLGVTIVARPVSASTEAPAAVDEIADHIDALLLAPDATVVTRELITFLIARSFDKKLPVLAFSQALAKLGVLAALAPSYAQNGKLCAALAKRVEAGEKPADLHGALQMTGSLIVNASTARRLGLVIPADVLKPPTEIVGQ